MNKLERKKMWPWVMSLLYDDKAIKQGYHQRQIRYGYDWFWNQCWVQHKGKKVWGIKGISCAWDLDPWKLR